KRETVLDRLRIADCGLRIASCELRGVYAIRDTQYAIRYGSRLFRIRVTGPLLVRVTCISVWKRPVCRGTLDWRRVSGSGVKRWRGDWGGEGWCKEGRRPWWVLPAIVKLLMRRMEPLADLMS